MNKRHDLRLEEPYRLFQPVQFDDFAGERWRDRLPRFRKEREVLAEFDVPTVPPPRGARGDAGADVTFVMDVSGSTLFTDPTGNRFTAARRIVNLLVEGIGGEQFDDRVGVVLFSDTARPWMPLTSISTREGRRQIRQILRSVGGGGTSIVPALHRAYAMQSHKSSSTAVVFVFTDGDSAETSDELAAAVRRLPSGSVHVVVLGDSLPAQWDTVPVGSITVLDQMDDSPDAFEWLLGRALYRSLNLEWYGPLTPPTTEGSSR